MRKTPKVVGIFLLATVAAVTGLATYVGLALPDVGDAPAWKLAGTPQQVARGAYLANSVCVCMDCHSQRNWAEYSAPPVNGTFGRGGERFDNSLGYPGRFVAGNITPYMLSDWTDGELYRVITTGVGKDGKALFPAMPYLHYGRMDEEDVKCIISYLRTLESIAYDPPASQKGFPLNILLNTLPQQADPQPLPSAGDEIRYGEYLTNAAACYDCHTPYHLGRYDEQLAFAGGFEFNSRLGVMRTPNITMDYATGIGTWSREVFINRFKVYADSVNQHIPVRTDEFNTTMPWTRYAGMSERDLGAIYAYLSSLPAVSHQVQRFEFRSP